MTETLINADFAQRVVVRAAEQAWIPSPQPGVERKPLDRIGGEVARATTLVRYAPGSEFPAHEHAEGEEYLVLEGVFSDEHGDGPVGTYVRNPPGSRHAPKSGPGAVILVKLRQMSPDARGRLVVETAAAAWGAQDAEGRSTLPLFADARETVSLERLAPGAEVSAEALAGGEEILVLSGELRDAHGTYGPWDWIRNPAGARRALSSARGAVYWTKRGHLPPPE